MNETDKIQAESTPESSLFTDLSVEETASVRGAYFHQMPYGNSYYSDSGYYRPIAAYRPPIPQHHYTYYSVANPDYLLA
jgi:hypothetical protein